MTQWRRLLLLGPEAQLLAGLHTGIPLSGCQRAALGSQRLTARVPVHTIPAGNKGFTLTLHPGGTL